MNVIVGILLVAVVALGWQWHEEVQTNNLLRGQMSALTKKSSAKENLEIQEKCANQAGKLFTQLGYSLSKDNASYQSHYNAKLNKCFISVDTTSGGTSGMNRFHFLMDAYEQKGYASYSTVFVYGKPPALILTSCELTPLGEKASTCKSQDEYDEFVARYME